MADICGRFVWYENLTTDAVAAVAFYRAVVGWDTQEWAAGTGEPYRMLGNGKAMLAGVMTLPPGAEAPPHWLGYIATPDAKATTARAEALGATIRVRLMEIPTVGTFSVIQDPQGAYFAAFTPASSEASPIRPPQVGEVSWHELLTTDAEAAFAFYADLFAWEKKSSLDMGPMGIYQVFGLSSLDLGGIFRKPADVPGPSHWRYYIRVADLDAALERVKANGGKVVVQPMDVPGGGRVAGCLDPLGAGFSLHWHE